MATAMDTATVGRMKGGCRCGRCVTVRYSRIDGGIQWIELRDWRWWNGMTVLRGTYIGDIIESPPGTTPQCPTCHWYVLPDGTAVTEQMQLRLGLGESSECRVPSAE